MDQQQSSSNRAGSTFIKCVGCAKLVRLPADPDPNAIVRCPRCDETYPIGVLLEGEIPELEIVDSEPIKEDQPTAPEVNIQTDEQNRFIVAPALAKGAKREKRRRPTGSRSNGQAGREHASGSDAGGRRRSESSQRKRRQPAKKPPSSGGEIFKIVLGAVMAPPVAQLVIWWGLQLDPLNLGPTVSKAIPIAVPAVFHADADGDEDAKTENDSDGNENSSNTEPDSPSDDEKKNKGDQSGWSG